MSDTPNTGPEWSTCTLEDGIVRGDTTITDLKLRKPRTGELRGLNLQDLMRLDIGALCTLVPRISDPTLTMQEVEAMTPLDIGTVGAQVLGFFMTAAQRRDTGLG